MRKVNRRDFLKQSRALAGSLALGNLVHAQPFGMDPAAAPNTSTYTRLNASHWGVYYGEVAGGRLTRIVPFHDEPYPNPSLQGLPDLLYSPTRIKYPMVREGYLKDRSKSDTSKRGTEPFVRVSWDQALDMVAEDLERVKTEYGNESIWGGSGTGWQSAGRFHSASGQLKRLLAMYGGFSYYVNTYSAPNVLVILPHVLGSGRPQNSTISDMIENSKQVVFFGWDPLNTTAIHHGGVGQNYSYVGYTQLRDAGVPIISINPVRTESDDYLRTEHIPIRPNTDTALMIAMAQVIYSEGLHDQEYLDKYTVGFAAFADYLTGKTDGQPKTPEWAAAITNIPADTIRDLARRIASGPTHFIGTYSAQRASHGAQPVWMMYALSFILGQFGKPGGGAVCNNPMSIIFSSMGYMPGIPSPMPQVANPVKTYTTQNLWSDMIGNPGKTIDYDGKTLTYPDIQIIVQTGGNNFFHSQDTNQLIRDWNRVPTTVYCDYVWTATAKYSDIVLPATTHMERNDITADRYYMFAMKQLVEPLFEARDDYDIWADLADRLGLKEQFTGGLSGFEWVQEMYRLAREQGSGMGLTMPAFDEFWEREYLQFEEAEATRKVVAYASFIEDPVNNALNTPSGRFEIYSQTIAGFGYPEDDSPPHPKWIEPREWLGSPKAATYPLHVLNPHSKYRVHSQMNNTFTRNWYEVNQREPMWISPADAAARELEDGDIARVFNDRGEILVGTVVTDRVQPGVIVIHEGAWYDPLEPGKPGTLCRHGSINVLTSYEGDSKLAQGNASNSLLAQVEKYTGPVPEITAFTPPTTKEA